MRGYEKDTRTETSSEAEGQTQSEEGTQGTRLGRQGWQGYKASLATEGETLKTKSELEGRRVLALSLCTGFCPPPSFPCPCRNV